MSTRPSGWWEHLKHNVRDFAEAPAGERFTRRYRRRAGQNGEQSWKSRLYIALGVGLIILGMLISIPPGMPGFLVTFLGLALIVERSRRTARLLDRAECWARERWRRWRGGSGG